MDLPDPDGPVTQRASPGATAKLTPRSASCSGRLGKPNETLQSSSWPVHPVGVKWPDTSLGSLSRSWRYLAQAGRNEKSCTSNSWSSAHPLAKVSA